MSDEAVLSARIAAIMREDRGRLVAALIRALGSFDMAEDALQDASERALVHWARNGIPARPDAWLLQVARRAAIDRIRKAQRHAAASPEVLRLMEEDEADRAMDAPEIPDERLRLIFTCCHPALEEKTRVALTLRTVGGLTTREIARAFLDSEPAMGQRLSRARAKISAAAIPFVVPERADWDQRLNSVLSVIYLIFNEGWTAGPGEEPIRTGLCDEAIWLARLMTGLASGEPEIEGLLALMLIAHARHAARFDPGGGMIPLEEQDRANWDAGLVDEGLALLDVAVARRLPGPFQLQAAIGALHVQAERPEATDWAQILLLYDRLLALAPSPIVALNRAVAMAETGALERARREMAALAGALAGYQPFHAATAELARRAGDAEVARAAYAEAIRLSQSESERAWLQARADDLADSRRM
ncbi:MAG: sigma-70 family RNA polymerase sigma factor [Silicimonas sp.]|nr:sigma-70 family RNA polymerase sigma factor [Silicimonas sp.]